MEELVTALELLIIENDAQLLRMRRARELAGFHSPSDELHIEYLRGLRTGLERLLAAAREETDRTPDVRESTPPADPPSKDDCLSDATRRDNDTFVLG